MTHALIREALTKLSDAGFDWSSDCWNQLPYDEWVLHQAQLALEALTTQGWRTDMENAPPNTDLLLYCPYRAESNPERIECGQFRNTRGGWQHSWATAWMLPPELPAPPTPNED